MQTGIHILHYGLKVECHSNVIWDQKPTKQTEIQDFSISHISDTKNTWCKHVSDINHEFEWCLSA